MADNDHVKIRFPLADDESQEFVAECLWAKTLGSDLYRVDNSPFDVYEISLNDVVKAIDIDGQLTFLAVHERGGHSTYRIKLSSGKNHADFLEMWGRFRALDCTFEASGSSDRIYAIDIPPGVDVAKVYEILEEGERREEFVFEEAHYFSEEIQRA